MSIVRVGLAETDKYGDGWNAVFHAGKAAPRGPARAKARKKTAKAKRSTAKKRK